MARTKSETKSERLAREVAKAVGAGVPWHLETVDFSDPNRPKTCLEVDFPILPINHIAAIEGNAGKPIYQMSKWWARRRSSVFRSMLIAAATKAPDDPAEAAKLVWDAYYGNHQKNEAFRKLKVADIFMGGGTTVVEGARLGMQMYGNDLNPVAWFIVKNELARVDPNEVQRLLDRIEAEVKPQIMPFYACDCPRGHKGKWTNKLTDEVLGGEFDPLTLKPKERVNYDYYGPYVTYAFWMKHGVCQVTGCNHRTPITATPVIFEKTLSVGVWKNFKCDKCSHVFDVEENEARIAPSALLVISPAESPYSVKDQRGNFRCPNCGTTIQRVLTAKSATKGIRLSVLLHPSWLRGHSPKSTDGRDSGGSTVDTATSTSRWNLKRAEQLRLLEVRGAVPAEIICPDTGEILYTDHRIGTVPKKSHFACAACGRMQDILENARGLGKDLPTAGCAIQGYCPVCEREGTPYGGRFLDIFDPRSYNASCTEWETRKHTDLLGFWPQSEFPYGLEADFWSVRGHGYTHFWKMFNSRQLLLHANLLRSILNCCKDGVLPEIRELIIGSFLQYLRNQCMFTLWNLQADKLEPHFSKNNYRPKLMPIENCFVGEFGRGNWASCNDGIVETAEWSRNPWELFPSILLENIDAATKSIKVRTNDPVTHAQISCTSSTDLGDNESCYDLIITDPPFGDLIQYAELADFFYVWLRIALRSTYPEYFTSEHSPRTLEVVSNKAREPENPDRFYQRSLTQCFSQCNKALKSSGILAFTFHHNHDNQWIAVLESVFDAGFYLEATYPIRSDETKGEGEFGSQKVEFDIIHVCRKRTQGPGAISWARLRRLILQDVRQLTNLLEQHHNAGLQEADLQVIRRGKALEYYSRHYGKVYVERGREFPVKDALLAINQILNEESDVSIEAPPAHAEVYTRQFFRLFADRTNLARDQIQKFLRGTGVSPRSSSIGAGAQSNREFQ